MATTKVESENGKEELKHLGFVKIYAINFFVFVTNLYEYAKQSSGPLQSGVRTVEGTVTSLIGPVYEKFKGVPQDFLVFLDNKVDEVTIKFDECAPPLAKQVTAQAWGMIQKASSLTQALVSEAQTKGVSSAVNQAFKKSEQFLSEKAVSAWFKLNQVPALHMVAEMGVPTAAHWSDKYNQTVTSMAQKGYTVFSYLPLLPVDKIAKAFKRGGEDAADTTKQHSN